ncbi:MAG: hypothetical protein KTR31_08290 [Myxococcales bacterium]|nr:hypothetical protein [Myxococcales bacterium]
MWLERLGLRDWSARDKQHAAAVVLLTALAVAHHCATWTWYIEDAAISFAYAKNLALGEGLVPFVGAERVEGYSNPSWVFFLAPFSFVGLDLHAAVRWIQVLLCIATVPLVYLAAREVLTPRHDDDSPADTPHAALVAPAIMAVSSQFARWGGAGLEIALMSFLMAAALWRSLVEVRVGGWPWSAALWFGVAISRPEAILYAAVAGFCSMVFHLHRRLSLIPTLKWLFTFFLPFGIYHAWRYSYFAWEFPNTYYAKLERRPNLPLFNWDSKPWRYTRDFMFEMSWGFFLPVWVFGAVGYRRWRTPFVLALCVAVGLVVELSGAQRGLLVVIVGATLAAFWGGLRMTEDNPPRWLAAAGLGVAVGLVALSELLRQRYGMSPNMVPAPDYLETIPPFLLIGLGVVLPLFGVGSRGWQGRMLTWWLCMAAVLFALIAQWDWMAGYRWYAPAVVPSAVLFSLGAESLGRFVQSMLSRIPDGWSWAGYATLAAVTLATIPANVVHTQKIMAKPQTRPEHVLVRVKYVDQVRDRLHVQERWVDLDVDQGAHLYWSDFEMIDIAGLIDVPLGHHKFERDFVREYVFEEIRPHFAHVHGGWASNSRIPTHPEWREQYVEIPGYVANKTQFHIGNHVRRDLIVGDHWEGRPQRVAFDDGIVLHGLQLPSEPGKAGNVYLELGVSSTRPRKTQADNFRIWISLSDDAGALHMWELPPGYDWLTPHEWESHQVFTGKFTLTLPKKLEPGDYDVGVSFVGADGEPILPIDSELPADLFVAGLDEEAPAARFVRGEVRFPSALTITAPDERDRLALADRDGAIAAASEDECDRAERLWFEAKMHHAGDEDWRAENRAQVLDALSGCWARASDGFDGPEQVALLVKARERDHWNRDYRDRAAALADDLHIQGLLARELEQWGLAYRWFADAVAVDRTRSWSRRYAEEARAIRLEFDDETLARKAEEKLRAIKEMRQRQRELAKERERKDAPEAP